MASLLFLNVECIIITIFNKNIYFLIVLNHLKFKRHIEAARKMEIKIKTNKYVFDIFGPLL